MAYPKRGIGMVNPVLGHREDMVIVDDVTTPSSDYWTWNTFISSFGTSNTTVSKEKEMEIGGRNCHLCGCTILQTNTDVVYKKKTHTVIVKRYECGTVVEKSYKSRGEGFEAENLSQHVILGDACVEV